LEPLADQPAWSCHGMAATGRNKSTASIVIKTRALMDINTVEYPYA